MPDSSTDRFTTDLPDTLTLRVGQVARVPLVGAMGAGNTWTATVDGEQVTARIEISPPPAQPDPAMRPQASGVPAPPVLPSSSQAGETLVVSAQSSGTVRVGLRLARSWTPDAALAEHALAVTVLPDR